MNKSDLRPQLGITLNSFDEFVLNREGGFVNAALSIYHTLDDYNWIAEKPLALAMGSVSKWWFNT